MSLRVIEGDTVNISQLFVDEYEDPLVPAEGEGGPVVTVWDIRDKPRQFVFQTTATPGGDPGSWVADLVFPVLNLSDHTDFLVEWVFTDFDGDRHRIQSTLIVEPSSVNRVVDIVVTFGQKGQFILPFPMDDRYSVTASMYQGNDPIMVDLDLTDEDNARLKKGTTKTRVTMPMPINPKRLEPVSLIVKVEDDELEHDDQLFTYNVWGVTPQVLVAASMVEQHINKAHLENVIPELEYTQADLVLYLYRGLSLFNNLPPHITGFNGLNMQGTLLNAWVTTSCYYALGAQLQAEGALAFDFSGQSVSFNVDRSPSIESALGRIENDIQGTVRELKKLLGKAGITTGDGSVGAGAISGGRDFGMVGISSAPTTKFRTIANTQRIHRS